MAYFMISVDDPQTNKEFAESLDSDFPLLSNPTKEVAEAYGVVTAERARTSMFLENTARSLERLANHGRENSFCGEQNPQK